MMISNINTLMEFRVVNPPQATGELSQRIGELTHPLYGVPTNLCMPVVVFTKLSNRYLYDLDGNKYPISNTHQFSIFTTPREAWSFFKHQAISSRVNVETTYTNELKLLDYADQCISKMAEQCPEYFV